jgi:nucleoside 2-deoxyribosyltransferase
MKIYLAGSIPKGEEEEKTFSNWRQRYEEVAGAVFPDATFITPKAGEVDETDVVLVLGKDSHSIKISDLVIVNAEEKLGAGTAMELVIAKYLGKPVITILPKDSYHRRPNLTFNGTLVEDWVHPFVAAFSDFVLEKIEDVAGIKDKIFSNPPKTIRVIDEAISRREDSLV